MNLLRREPVALFGALQALLVAVWGVVGAFTGASLTDEQIAALAALWAALTGAVTLLVRSRVSPTDG